LSNEKYYDVTPVDYLWAQRIRALLAWMFGFLKETRSRHPGRDSPNGLLHL
jgi:hypothetical protein